MMKKIFTLFAFLFCFNVFAANSTIVDVSKLTPEQAAQIKQQISELSSSPTNISSDVRKEAEAWGELGANMGKAMVGAAKEVGVAANEFSQTSLGKIVVFFAAYKIVGNDLLGVVFGTFILIFGYSIAIWVLTTKRWSKVSYEYEPVLWGMYKKARIVNISTDSDTVTTKVIIGGGLLALSTIVGLNTIF